MRNTEGGHERFQYAPYLDLSSFNNHTPDLSLIFPPSPKNMEPTPQAPQPCYDTTGSDVEAAQEKVEEWKPRREEYMVMLTMSVCSLMVALDATILVTVLPVCV